MIYDQNTDTLHNFDFSAFESLNYVTHAVSVVENAKAMHNGELIISLFNSFLSNVVLSLLPQEINKTESKDKGNSIKEVVKSIIEKFKG